jgi:CBS domain containing-hemolysin-like protein
VIALSLDATVAEALATFRTAGHSRLPVFHETLDDPRGMIHIRDFLDFLASNPAFGLIAGEPAPAEGQPKPFDMSTPLSQTPLARPVLFAPPSMPALDLLARMQASRIHIALVIDEYGGTDGLVSMEFTVEARTPLDEVAQAVGLDLSDLEEAEEADTIGGLVAALAGRLPVRGEIVAGPQGFEFEVLDADPRRLKRVRIHPPGPDAAPGPAEAQPATRETS